MPDDVRDALEAAYAQHDGSPPAEGDGSTAATTSTDAKTASPARGTGTVPAATSASSTDAATRQPSDEDDESKDDNWRDLDKRQRILKNRSAKERAAVYAEVKERWGGLDPTDPNVAANIRAFYSNPRQYVQQYGSTWGLTLAEAQAQAATPPTNGKASAFSLPEPTLVAQDGTAAYDAKQIAAIYEHINARLAEHEQRVQPLQQTHEELVQQRQWAESLNQADAVVRDMETWPGFSELRPKIVETFKGLVHQANTGQIRVDQIPRVETIYRQLFASEHLPKLEEKARQKALADLKSAPSVPVGTTPATQARSGSEKRKGGMTAHEAILHSRRIHGVQ
jgi:hypothetical protein